MGAARIAVGSRIGLKSGIWKIWTQGDEIYASSRLFGGLAKVSLHSTGECQWSFTDVWVRNQPGRRNAERHIAKWKVHYPNDEHALLLLRIAIPASELRDLPPPTDQKRVLWIGNVPTEATVQLLLYVTSAQDLPPTTDNAVDHRRLASFQLRSGRWLVLMVHLVSLCAQDVAEARDMAIAQTREAGIAVRPGYRIAFYAPPSLDNSAALLEVAAALYLPKEGP